MIFKVGHFLKSGNQIQTQLALPSPLNRHVLLTVLKHRCSWFGILLLEQRGSTF